MESFQGSRISEGEYAGSTMRCAKCGTYVTPLQQERIARFDLRAERECLGCADKLYLFNVIVDILPSSERFLNTENVKNSVWYHATNRENWMAALLDDKHGTFPLVHVGTKEAAITIIADQYVQHDALVYFYKVKLAPTAMVSKTLFEDKNIWPIRTHELEGPDNTFRYVNRHEATGSISLLVDPRELIIEDVEVFTPLQTQNIVRQIEVFDLVATYD